MSPKERGGISPSGLKEPKTPWRNKLGIPASDSISPGHPVEEEDWVIW